MTSHDLWLVGALVFFLLASVIGFTREESPNVRFWGLHPGWFACAMVTCYFLIK